MEESKIRKLIMKHSVEYHECSKKGIYVNELYVDEFVDELIYELNQERAKDNAETSGNSLHKHIVSDSCEWCGTEKENRNGLCRECGRFPSPGNYR